MIIHDRFGVLNNIQSYPAGFLRSRFIYRKPNSFLDHLTQMAAIILKKELDSGGLDSNINEYCIK